ncbi:hemolysin family protein [Actinocorallia sp. A-T 12471]|uniref:hemolysin family protein n=1 Tax=Actinocorallia sp. A-T 12471 TaxID=3089813 RepID=UPI0029CEA982|nr:hemolysin family protein [Actinocorallia sp. A-T 12471]MDX6741975.1 hemolysin family protein [Actinocorallia sp. A-T 12471]
MSAYAWNIVLVLVLVGANAVFAGSEIALVSLREGQLRSLERRKGRSAKALVRLARDPNRFLATIQVGITLAGFLASATAAVTLSRPLVEPLGFLGGAANAVAIALVTLVLTFLTLVLGELAPKRLAMQRAEGWALLVARPLDLLATLTRPVVWALGKATDGVVRILRGDPKAAKEQLGAEELRDLVAGQRGLTAEQRTIITGALDIHDRTLRSVLRPRPQVFVLRADLPVAEARTALAESGHSRAPVAAARHVDDIVGVANLRELITADGTLPVARACRPALTLPESLKVAAALRTFRVERQQFALVIDEYGTVAGIVTLEDLLEEIVGEIYDEHDRDVLAVAADDGALVVPGSFPLHDLPDVGVRLSHQGNADYTTVAGLVLALLGRIPDEPGDTVRAEGWELEVTGLDRHAISSVRIRPSAVPDDGDETAAAGP